ncbi:unnamed protein product, partial [marine sediment metagenome]
PRIEASLDRECKKYVLPSTVLLINFVLCNLESLPVVDKVDRKMEQLLKVYPEAQNHVASTIGLVLWKELLKEI